MSARGHRRPPDSSPPSSSASSASHSHHSPPPAASAGLRALAGKFIVFDGPDGCGKTTQLKTLITKLEQESVTVRRLREPGGTPIGEQIRELLLSTKTEGMDLHCEMLLYMASRAQLVHEHIKPALKAGECVVADRFASSTLAYQGGGGGMKVDDILRVAQIAVDNTWPDLTIVFDLDTDVAMERLNPLWSGGRKKTDEQQSALFDDSAVKDRIEQRARDYFVRVRENYLWQAKQWPDRYRVVDAGKSIAQVEKQVFKTLKEFFGIAREE
ncbi:MAG TPA: dTMP kinase [Phycisphaerae bacterium]|nr:dTMP kinase [Phycisphaerae bacterium]